MTEGDGPIFASEWIDEEWRGLAGQHYQRQLTPEEGQRYVRGPRIHPFGLDAWQVIVDGKAAVFRNEAAYKRWKRDH